jgi:hypothetical protein
MVKSGWRFLKRLLCSFSSGVLHVRAFLYEPGFWYVCKSGCLEEKRLHNPATATQVGTGKQINPARKFYRVILERIGLALIVNYLLLHLSLFVS